MDVMEESFFGWNVRRVVLRAGRRSPKDTVDVAVPPPDLDMSLTIGSRRARLITFVDHGDDYVVLVVGDASGRHDVPVRAVDAETLLIRGSQSRQAVEILVVLPSTLADDTTVAQRDLDGQLCAGGPIREMLAATGAMSVTVEWCGTTSLVA